MFPLFRKHSLWLPTWQALLAAAVIIGAVAWIFIANIHSYLAVTERAEGAKILVIEGWISDVALAQQLEGFEPGEPYDHIFTTGSALPKGYYLSEYRSYAELTAKTLEHLGVPGEHIIVAATDHKTSDRTYQCAVAFKEKLAASAAIVGRPGAVDILTGGVHSRRTRSVFQKILGEEIEVGIISEDQGGYDQRRWYTTSEGVKSVIIETISLVYEWFGGSGR